jgi:hypothetical protein
MKGLAESKPQSFEENLLSHQIHVFGNDAEPRLVTKIRHERSRRNSGLKATKGAAFAEPLPQRP